MKIRKHQFMMTFQFAEPCSQSQAIRYISKLNGEVLYEGWRKEKCRVTRVQVVHVNRHKNSRNKGLPHSADVVMMFRKGNKKYA